MSLRIINIVIVDLAPHFEFAFSVTSIFKGACELIVGRFSQSQAASTHIGAS